VLHSTSATPPIHSATSSTTMHPDCCRLAKQEYTSQPWVRGQLFCSCLYDLALQLEQVDMHQVLQLAPMGGVDLESSPSPRHGTVQTARSS